VHPRNQIPIALGHDAGAQEQESVALLYKRKTCEELVLMTDDVANSFRDGHRASIECGGGGSSIALAMTRGHALMSCFE
jgi:hypothetical protein